MSVFRLTLLREGRAFELDHAIALDDGVESTSLLFELAYLHGSSYLSGTVISYEIRLRPLRLRMSSVTRA